MKTKRYKSLLHVWITFASVVSFLGGWIVFSHSTKPAALFTDLASTSPQSAAALAPIPSLDTLTANSSSSPTALQPLTSYQLSSQPSTTVLRTRGS